MINRIFCADTTPRSIRRISSLLVLSGSAVHSFHFHPLPRVAEALRETKLQDRLPLSKTSQSSNVEANGDSRMLNLIALPLQLEPRKAGNSVFVDRNLQPFEDQWTYLSSIIRLRTKDLDSIVRDAAAKDVILNVPFSSDDPDSEEPWKKKSFEKSYDKKFTEPYPKEIEIVQSNMLYVPKEGFSSKSLSKLMGIAAFQNPEFYRNKQLGSQRTTHHA